MAGSLKGYLSNPQYSSQKFQLLFFNKFVKEIKHLCKSIVTIFAPGNHDFDAGFEDFEDCIKKMDAKIIVSNIDYKNSKPSLKQEISKQFSCKLRNGCNFKQNTKNIPSNRFFCIKRKRFEGATQVICFCA